MMRSGASAFQLRFLEQHLTLDELQFQFAKEGGRLKCKKQHD